MLAYKQNRIERSAARVTSLVAFCLFISGCTLFQQQKPLPPVKAAPFVDLNAYSGMWYEVAYLPTHFQVGCRCSMLSYARTSPKTGIALSACVKGKDDFFDIKKAKIITMHNSGHAKHKIQVIWPFKHDYWILYVDKNYRYALAGTPNHRYLWLLSRTPVVPPKIYYGLLGIAGKQGYNLKKIHLTQQSCSPVLQRRLVSQMRKRIFMAKTRMANADNAFLAKGNYVKQQAG